jgi:hypothetical protein
MSGAFYYASNEEMHLMRLFFVCPKEDNKGAPKIQTL